MKVALVIEWLDAWRGGAETSTLQFVHHLMDTDVELHVFTRSRPSSTPGMTVHTISGAAMSRTRRSVTFAHRVERIIQSDTFDVVHAISPMRGADLYQPRGGTVAETIQRNVALRSSQAGRIWKRWITRLNLKQRYMLAVERQILGDKDGPLVVAISDYVAEQLKRHYGLPEARIRRIYNGVDADEATADERAAHRDDIRREFAIPDHALLVLVIAHNFRLKGVQRWMEAQAELLRRSITNVRSLVVGKGDGPRWHRLAASMAIEEHLSFTGPTDRVQAFRHAADILVHPTYYDPCSRVVLEGMVAGLPCITTRWDGASETIENGKNGFVLDDPGDVASLVACVGELRDPTRRRALGRAAAQVADRVSMARHTREIQTLYEEIGATAEPIARSIT